MRNHSYENEFRLQVHFHVNQTHFHMKGFARRLVLKQRYKGTRKWPIYDNVGVLSALSVIKHFSMSSLGIKSAKEIKKKVRYTLQPTSSSMDLVKTRLMGHARGTSCHHSRRVYRWIAG